MVSSSRLLECDLNLITHMVACRRSLPASDFHRSTFILLCCLCSLCHRVCSFMLCLFVHVGRSMVLEFSPRCAVAILAGCICGHALTRCTSCPGCVKRLLLHSDGLTSITFISKHKNQCSAPEACESKRDLLLLLAVVIVVALSGPSTFI